MRPTSSLGWGRSRLIPVPSRARRCDRQSSSRPLHESSSQGHRGRPARQAHHNPRIWACALPSGHVTGSETCCQSLALTEPQSSGPNVDQRCGDRSTSRQRASSSAGIVWDMAAPDEIHALLAKFQKFEGSYVASTYKEAEVRREFIDAVQSTPSDRRGST